MLIKKKKIKIIEININQNQGKLIKSNKENQSSSNQGTTYAHQIK